MLKKEKKNLRWVAILDNINGTWPQVIYYTFLLAFNKLTHD